ncbi:MAG TPA: AbrB/MazE/SpoVT family DNA-binding domain-containing protein [Bryocella sp.]|nr:AbrB/MazE/SpoVT family DNA-binding domain-containing protein [Bryocella sp.]
MRQPFTTTMSSRGQVVIPDEIRRGLRLEPGTAFIVVARGDTIVLQRLKEPPWKEFDVLTKQAQSQGHHLDQAMSGFRKAINKMRYGR